MFAVVGAVFFIGGLIFVFNPFGMAAKYIKFTSSMGGPRISVDERYMSRRVGTVLVFAGGGMLAARVLLALGVETGVLTSLLPVAGLALFALVGYTIFAIYRASSRREDS